MEFVGDILSLDRPATREFNLLGASLPSSKDVYFVQSKRDNRTVYCCPYFHERNRKH